MLRGRSSLGRSPAKQFTPRRKEFLLTLLSLTEEFGEERIPTADLINELSPKLTRQDWFSHAELLADWGHIEISGELHHKTFRLTTSGRDQAERLQI